MISLNCPSKKEFLTTFEQTAFKEEDFALVSKIFENVQKKGDDAIKHYTKKFDSSIPSSLKIDLSNLDVEISEPLKEAIKKARENIERFHAIEDSVKKDSQMGITCWSEWRPIDTVGLYVPGGSAPLFSTLLMLVIPAKIAGCKNIVLCTPPIKNEDLPHKTILYTAKLLGIKSLYVVGGAQAIAGMAIGTETIPKVHKIFGPGNMYVTIAKTISTKYNTAIDMPAGPSEVLVIADEECPPQFVAADLLAQAEHDTRSKAVLICFSEKYKNLVFLEIEKIYTSLRRTHIIQKSMEESVAIVVKTIGEALTLSNTFAPEHLILAIKDAEKVISKVENAGSVFLGYYSPETVGDYASGTNHTLPTNGYSKSYSGVSTRSFMKRITFQKVSKEGLKNIAPTVSIMAEEEGLDAHKHSVSVRL